MAMFNEGVRPDINPKYADIVENYLYGKGNEEAKEDFNLSNVDRFGVYHPEGLKAIEEDKETKKRFLRSLDKWRDMTASYNLMDSPWNKHFHDGFPSEKLLHRTFKGVPPQFRTIVWPLFLEANSVKRRNPNVFSAMLRQALTSSDDIGQIDLDINRTFRNTTYFHDRFGPRQLALFKILVAYSAYDTEVGYCQGMSDLVGMLLTYIVDDEDAFWTFAQLMTSSRHQLHGVFKTGFPGLTRLFTQHELILRRFLPSIAGHFTRHQVETGSYALKWFMQCFMNRLPLSLVLRLWDIYLLVGESILLAMAYNILKMHKRRLLEMDGNGILSFLQDELPKDFKHDDNTTIKSLHRCLERLEHHHMSRPPTDDDRLFPKLPLGKLTPDNQSLVSESLSALCTSSSVNNRLESVGDGSSSQRSQSVWLPTTWTGGGSSGKPAAVASSASTPWASASVRSGLLNSAAIVTMSAMNRQSRSQRSDASSLSAPTFVLARTSSSQSCAAVGTGHREWAVRAVDDEVNRPVVMSHRPRIMDHSNFRLAPRDSPAWPQVRVDRFSSVPCRPRPPRQSGDAGNLEHTGRLPTVSTVITIRQLPNTVDALDPSERLSGVTCSDSRPGKSALTTYIQPIRFPKSNGVQTSLSSSLLTSQTVTPGNRTMSQPNPHRQFVKIVTESESGSRDEQLPPVGEQPADHDSVVHHL